jgi:magnesium chelatase accessory protein
MAADIRSLCGMLGVRPFAIVGHSAGAAIGLRLVADDPRPLVAINGAFQMFDGVAAWLFPVVAKTLAVNPLTPRLFTLGSTPERTRKLLAGTGSTLDDEGLMQMHRLFSDHRHVGGALNMMANWSLTRLLRSVPKIEAPVLLIASEGDKAIPAAVSRDLAGRLPDARLHVIPTLGHLVHEEAPADVAEALLPFLSERVAA